MSKCRSVSFEAWTMRMQWMQWMQDGMPISAGSPSWLHGKFEGRGPPGPRPQQQWQQWPQGKNHNDNNGTRQNNRNDRFVFLKKKAFGEQTVSCWGSQCFLNVSAFEHAVSASLGLSPSLFPFVFWLVSAFSILCCLGCLSGLGLILRTV